MRARGAAGGAGARPARADAVRFVVVTLDHHLAGAFARAQAAFDTRGPAVDIAFHAAADWDDRPDALERCRADIASADILLVSMLFLEDHVRAVLPAIEARRDACDAVVGLMAAGEVVRLTRMGSYRMDAPAKGPLALLKRLRGSARPGASSGEGQMRMLRRLPKILRFIPGTAQDVRQYFLTLQYWLAGSDDNVTELVKSLIDRYADGPRRHLRGTLGPKAPAHYPEVGVYHPALPERLTADPTRLPRPRGATGTVGLLLLRSYVLARDTAHYDGVIAALEAQGLAVIPAFAAGLDARPAVERCFLKGDGSPRIDALVSLTGFSLVGGPAYNDAAAAEALLARLDVPLVAAHPLEFQSLQRWGAGRIGLTPMESTMMVAIPELDGATGPIVFGGRSDGQGQPCSGCAERCDFAGDGPAGRMQSCPERARMLAARVARLVALRQTPRSERRLGVVLFNFPPGAGAAGTAAFLSVFESLWNLLAALRAAGWTVELPADAAALRAAVLEGNAARYGTEANLLQRVPTDELVAREPHLAEIEARWGPAPGRVNADGGHVQLLGARFGHVAVMLQPAIGIEGDPMRLMMEGGFPPTHAMSAFYRHLREDFAAHAILHFGTHGALEFLPGRQTGLGAGCWPDRLIGAVPSFYLYAANNPSEGMLARRRIGATLISHLTPPVAEAGLWRGLAELKATLARWQAEPDAEARARLAEALTAAAAALDLDGRDPERLAAAVYELETTLIPQGLHVLGRPMAASARETMVALMPEEERERAARLLAEDHELPALVRALDGAYVRPAPGGDLVRNPAILPTGRNLHGFDPFALPDRFAMAEGARQAGLLIARHVADHGRPPAAIAMVLWGTDNLKSGGQAIAQAMALMGAEPRFDGYGRLSGAELVPLDRLGRARVDVVITLSGIFRDLLPLQTRMLAEAALLASLADEPQALNPIAARSRALAEASGCDLETAALRVFSNAQGAYGANVNLMIDGSAWTDPDELAASFERQKGHAYGVRGAPVHRPDLLAATLAGCDLAYQNLESVELGVTAVDQYVDSLGGLARLIARGAGHATPVYIGDQTGRTETVRRLEEQVALETRTRMLNPAWIEPLLAHGGEGVRQIEAGVTATLGWSATTGEVSPWVWQRLSETYVLDEAMRERLAALNPRACARLAGRLIEASDRHFWAPDAATLDALHDALDRIEDRMEGVPARSAEERRMVA